MEIVAILHKWWGASAPEKSSVHISELNLPIHSYDIYIISIRKNNWNFKTKIKASLFFLQKSIDCLIQHTIFSTIQHQQNFVN